ncbi:MAG: hypothetical protein ACRDND_18040, partial [Streptosporangiaceae bacterium]
MRGQAQHLAGRGQPLQQQLIALLQTVLGLSPVQAGLAGAAPMSLSAFAVSVAIGRHLHAWNPRWIIGGGMALVGAGALLQAGL